MNMRNLDKPVEYRIDNLGRIIFVNDAWHEFYSQNGGRPQSYLGERLMAYVRGFTVASVYQALFTQVRSSGRVMRLPFRCDSPELRRRMEMEIALGRNGELNFRTHILEMRPRTAGVVQLLPPFQEEPPPDAKFLRMCAWCQRIDIDGWIEVDDAVRQLELLEDQSKHCLTHTICPVCRTEVMKK